MDKTLLLSIHPEYADKIFSGHKTVELRRIRPQVSNGDIVLVYKTSPRMALSGAFRVFGVLEHTPGYLWTKVGTQSGINRRDFDTYYSNASKGYGILIDEAWTFEEEIPLNELRQAIPGFQPPQGYRYLANEELELLGLTEILSEQCESLLA